MYLQEKEDKETLEFPEKGFVTYKVTGKTCHVCIIYVHPLERKNMVVRELMNALINKVKRDCTGLSAACYTMQNDTTKTMKILLHYGFEIVGVDREDILLYKELK